MIKFEIKHRFSGAVLFSLECGSLELCVEAAVKSRANLSGANLSRANLYGADLYGADLSEAKNLSPVWIARQRITPEEGAFVGWKKLKGGVIARLVIPHDAKRANALGSRKCRAERVFVHAMWDMTGKEIREGVSVPGLYDSNTTYTVGKETLPDSYNDSNEVECSNGIHFYMTRLEAENHA